MIDVRRQTATLVDRHVGRRLRQQRALCGLALKQLAQAVDIPADELAAYEAGEEIAVGLLQVLADELGMPVGWFWEDVEVPVHPNVIPLFPNRMHRLQEDFSQLAPALWPIMAEIAALLAEPDGVPANLAHS